MTVAARPHHLHLTPRDVQILLMVYRYDGMVNMQIQRRFWPRFGSRSPYYQRLSRLISAGYLRSIRLPSQTGSGSGPSLITLGPHSHPILRELLGLETADLKRLRRSFVPMFWQHDAACRDFRLSLELACDRSPGVELREWINESELKSLKDGLTSDEGSATTRALHLVPDGIFTLMLASGRSKRFFVELDRGTQVSPRRFKRKLAAYFASAETVSSPVLFVVPNDRRRDQIIRWITEEARSLSAGPQIFAAALLDDVTERSVLHAPIWQMIDGRRISLVPPPTSYSHVPIPHASPVQGDPVWSS